MTHRDWQAKALADALELIDTLREELRESKTMLASLSKELRGYKAWSNKRIDEDNARNIETFAGLKQLIVLTEATSEERRAELEGLQWGGYTCPRVDCKGKVYCLSCGKTPLEGHKPDCRRAKLIAKEGD